MNEYLVRFVQLHESFRVPELQALAQLASVTLEVVDYRQDSPFCIVRLPSDDAARKLVGRSVLATSISSLWGSGAVLESLHNSVQARTSALWPKYRDVSFRFDIDSFRGKRPQSSKAELINGFSYMKLMGPIRPSDPDVDEVWTISEEYALRGPGKTHRSPFRLFLSRLVSMSARDAVGVYDLKKRNYISTTSMDAELSLVTANMALASAGKVVYDPFCGTGSFLVAAAHFGAMTTGSDMDGRVVRGKIKNSKNAPTKKYKVAFAASGSDEKKVLERSVRGNLAQYHLEGRWLDGFVSDLTNSPIRIGASSTTSRSRWLDAIVCDPPYGVREGLKVLGSHKPELQEVVKMADGTPAHLAEGYIPPKRPYSFDAMLADILAFAADALVDDGRLCIWIPAENVDTETGDQTGGDLGIPMHPCLHKCSVSTQDFTRWSRRLVVYGRLPDSDVDTDALVQYNAMKKDKLERGTADELNEFRRRFFEGFKQKSDTAILSPAE
ncbi:tRNA guanosine-2'-O-methyltransferase [Myriangium duriaei CBS 260.36]|uniref:tRNA (guanine(10)-N(2))-methyltransferase n=1 Tax=Myriangium duriaei CBS 260.36 TaxID=1168546 RepID=A0A9P4J6Y0_9PEZI|nr:tRNA guanosine-2'-O-methyltransferase [Myriangium duriaei CBS 260.36]